MLAEEKTFAGIQMQVKKGVAMFLLKEVNILYDNFSDRVYEENILDKKTKELLALACSVMVDCVPCIDWHYKQAVKAGATKDEISEALAITMSVSAGSKRAKYAALISDLEHGKK